MTYIGTIGMFLTAMWLFVRILPMISIFEMRTLLPEAHVHEAEEVKRMKHTPENLRPDGRIRFAAAPCGCRSQNACGAGYKEHRRLQSVPDRRI
jgi:hypothetical protein